MARPASPLHGSSSLPRDQWSYSQLFHDDKYSDAHRGVFKLVHTEFKDKFSKEELENYLHTFMVYDADNSAELEVLELNKMYEKSGQTKTRAELEKLITDSQVDIRAGSSKIKGLNYREFMVIILKEKTGELKGPMAFGAAVLKAFVKPKEHKSPIGNKANVFEQKAAENANSQIKADNDMASLKAKGAEKAAKRQAAAEAKAEKENAEAAEAARKKAALERVAALQSRINGPGQ